MTSIDSRQVAWCELNLSTERICRFLGYGNAKASKEVIDIINLYLSEMEQTCEPVFGYRIVAGEVLANNTLLLEGQDFNPGPVISRYLKGCSQYIVMVATAGHSFNNWLTNIHVKGDILCSYIADAFGSAIADTTAEIGVKYLEAEAVADTRYITNSYSPGYCDWNVSEQRTLFSLLPDNFCGITLNDSCLMHPIKSISSVIGLDENAKYSPYGCAICKRKDCYLRIASAKRTR